MIQPNITRSAMYEMQCSKTEQVWLFFPRSISQQMNQICSVYAVALVVPL